MSEIARPLSLTNLPITPLQDSCSVIDVVGGVDAQTLANALISSSGGAEISNAVLTGDPRCAGTFTTVPGEGYNLPGSGVVISSGNALNITGPNDSSSTTTNFGAPGDADLDGLIPGFTTRDACVLEFDLTCPNGGGNQDLNVTFNYVFGSEEYNEFVDSQFNDVLGFFLNGKTPSNNVARLPDGSPVSINNVNNDVNSAFYNDNSAGGICIEMDGFTTVLTASRTAQQGTNTIKLAVADAGDSSLDSWVLFEGGTFDCTPSEQCNIQEPPDYSDCPKSQSRNFCCSQSNPSLPNKCVNQIGGQPCGKGPAQEDMCSGTEGEGGCGVGKQCCKDQNTNGDFCCMDDGLNCKDLEDGFCTPTTLPTPMPTPFPTNKPTPFPTNKPTQFPTNMPTNQPNTSPTPSPTKMPTPSPTNVPSTPGSGSSSKSSKASRDDYQCSDFFKKKKCNRKPDCVWDPVNLVCNDVTDSPTLAPATTGPTMDYCAGLNKKPCKITDGCYWDKYAKECIKDTPSSTSGSSSSADVAASNQKVVGEVVSMVKSPASGRAMAEVSALVGSLFFIFMWYD